MTFKKYTVKFCFAIWIETLLLHIALISPTVIIITYIHFVDIKLIITSKGKNVEII